MDELEATVPMSGVPASPGLNEEACGVRHPLSARAGVEEVELQHVERRFESLRVPAPRRLEALMRSLERSGQLSALIAVREEASHVVLVDGYLRLTALRRLGVDTAWVEVRTCALSEALLSVLAAAHARRWDVLEEALMLRELTGALGLSQHQVAQRAGRDVSWVNRRLTLLDSLSESLLEAVCQGVVSSWAASRVLAPLARANTAHAQALLGALGAEPLSTRELHAWYQHYRQANRPTRERLVENPALFVHTLRAREEASSSQRLREGLEGQCLADVHGIEAVLKRLRRRLARVCAHTTLPQDVHQALMRMRRAFARLDDELHGYRVDDPTPDPRGRPHARGEADPAA